MTASLTDTRLQSIARIQHALLNIERLRLAVNDAEQVHSLPMRRLQLPELGMLWHEIEELVCAQGSDACETGRVHIASAEFQESEGQR